MKFLPSLTAVLLICITLNVVRPDDDTTNKCEETVNFYRKEAGLRELEVDREARARLIKNIGWETCLTKDQMENGIDGFTVTSFTDWTVPKGILSPDVKTFVCINGPPDCNYEIYFVFIKYGVTGCSIGKWFFMVAILAIYNLF